MKLCTLVFSVFVAIVVSACSGGNSGSKGSDTKSTSFIHGSGVKGPLAQADVYLYQLDVSAANLRGALVATGTTGDNAAIQDLSLATDTTGYLVLEFSVNANTIDISSGQAPIFNTLISVLDSQYMLNGGLVYATPLTTMAVDLAQRNADTASPYIGDGNGSTSEAEFVYALDIAQRQLKSTLGFGLADSVDIFTTPPLINDDTDNSTLQSEVAAYRQAIEAVSAVTKQISENSSAEDSPEQILEAIVIDLSDGDIDGRGSEGEVAVLAALDDNIGTILSEIDLDTLTIPNTNTPINEIESVLAEETQTTGTITNTSELENGTIVVDTTSVKFDSDIDGDLTGDSNDHFPTDPNEWTDTDRDGVGDNGDAFPSDREEWLDSDGDGVGNNADLDDDNDLVEDTEDAFPFNENESLDTDEDGVGNNADNDDDNDTVNDLLDVFPLDPSETIDSDNDGVGDNSDVFPEDPTRSALEEQLLIFELQGDLNVQVGSTIASVALGSGTGTVTYQSSNLAVATVDNEGQVTAISVGESTISASIAADEIYAAATSSYTFTVYDPVSIEFSQPGDHNLLAGDTLQNPVTYTHQANITYSSSNTEVAVVDGEGTVTAIQFGSAEITVNIDDGNTTPPTNNYSVFVLDSFVMMDMWIGANNTIVSFAPGSEGAEYYRSTDPNCDITNIYICANGQVDVITSEPVIDTTLAIGQDAYHHVTVSSKKATMDIGTSRFDRVKSQATIVFKDRLWVIGGDDGDFTGDDHLASNAVWATQDGNIWTKYSNAEFSPRNRHGVAVFQDKLWIIGGYDVEVGNLSDIWSSPDGINWTRHTNSAPFGEKGGHELLVYNNQLWLMAGEGADYRASNDVWTSEDGINWTQVTAAAAFPEYTYMRTVVFNNKMMIIGGAGLNREIWSSTDGETWTQEGTGNFDGRNGHEVVALNNKLWLLGGNDSSLDWVETVWQSDDGIQWVQVPQQNSMVGRSFFGMSAFKGRLWIIGGMGQGFSRLGDVRSSADGGTWNIHELGADMPGRVNHQVISFNERLWVIGGWTNTGDNSVWSSEDGLQWREETASAEFTRRDNPQVIVHDDKLWLIGGSAYRNDVWSSEDGIYWVEETASAAFEGRNYHQAVSFNNKMWVIGGHSMPGPDEAPATVDRADVWSSNDGINWIEDLSTAPFAPQRGHSVVVFNDKIWVFTGRSFDGGVWSSEDGVNWVQVTDAAPFEAGDYSYRALAGTDKLYLIGTQGNSVWSSVDGVNWVQEQSEISMIAESGFKPVLHNDSLWLIGGAYNKVQFYPTPEVWRSQDGGQTWRLGLHKILALQ